MVRHHVELETNQMINKTCTHQVVKSAEKREQHQDYLEIETLVSPCQMVEVKYWREGHQSPGLLNIQGKTIPELIALLQAVEIHKRSDA